MTKREVVKRFQREYLELYVKKADYWRAHEAWAFFVDDLNREGEVTDKQASTWSTPFPYGKPLKPTRKMLEAYCLE